MDFPDDEFGDGWLHSDEDDYDAEDYYEAYYEDYYDSDYDVDIQNHEMFLFEYSPESKEVEDLTGLDVLKVSDMTIKLVEAIKLRLDSEEIDR